MAADDARPGGTRPGSAAGANQEESQGRGIDPRGAILAAARGVFATRGYARTTIKGVAAAAGVAPEVARRYYDNKGDLFAAAMRLPADPSTAVPALLAPGLEGLGDRLVRFTLEALDDPEVRADVLGMVKAGGNAYSATRSFQEFIESGIVDRVVTVVGVPDARMRVALISSYLLGVATARYVLRIEPLASASDEHVVRMVGPTLQALIDPRVPLPGDPKNDARTDFHADAGDQA